MDEITQTAPTETESDAGREVDHVNPDMDTSDPLAEFRTGGGVRLAEYQQADKVRLANGDEISGIALAAVGATTADGRAIGDAERENIARGIDQSVRQHAAWLDSRPLMEQVQGNVRPVVFVATERDPA